MSAPSEMKTSEALREEIRQLEAELGVIDQQLAKSSARLEITDQPSDPEDSWLAAATEASARRSERDRALSSALRSGAGASLAPYKRVSFRKEAVWKSDRDSRLLRWIGAGVLIGALGGFWFGVIRPALGGPQTETPSRSATDAYTGGLKQDLRAAEESLRTFYRAGSVDALLGSVRESEALEPMIRAHYEKEPLISTEIEILGSMERVHHFEESFVLAIVRHPGTPERGRQVAVELTRGGAKVDWELATNVQRLSWEQLPLRSAEAAHSSPFRVELEDGQYYNHDFDEKDWVCFRVRAPEVDRPDYAYAPRSSPLARHLLSLVRMEEPRPAQVVASLVLANRDEVIRQLLIRELVSDHWLVPDDTLPLGGPSTSQRLASYN